MRILALARRRAPILPLASCSMAIGNLLPRSTARLPLTAAGKSKRFRMVADTSSSPQPSCWRALRRRRAVRRFQASRRRFFADSRTGARTRGGHVLEDSIGTVPGTHLAFLALPFAIRINLLCAFRAFLSSCSFVLSRKAFLDGGRVLEDSLGAWRGACPGASPDAWPCSLARFPTGNAPWHDSRHVLHRQLFHRHVFAFLAFLILARTILSRNGYECCC